ncbi:M14 family zinc carboxypeptidase [Psychroflexus aestuariivivens]|uniref:M14 family zinc carboxypeptidase n=1 Tax=Psychroflexus aestuariivivens TaxID=1795040 RepID=UPI000FDB1322|nr:M14 family zinc carboxypeptidase [Psychroflexus aestuariivivens]
MNLNLDFYKSILDNYDQFKVKKLIGRYLSESDLLATFKDLSHRIEIKNEGFSVEKRIVSSFKLGTGSKKILIWSQMHGNETTTTKAVMDFIHFCLDSKHTQVSKEILNTFTLKIIPVLNPDGAYRYTRFNANSVDLNRDATNLNEPESQILRRIFEEFQPDFCFNMHDQRTIFSAGNQNKSAGVSFLSPAYNKSRDVNITRQKAMSLIASANSILQNFIPNQVGRYDDQFNINCVGDYFQNRGVPTVLFEAGQISEDYKREDTRKFILISILEMLLSIMNENFNTYSEYFEIPENEKLFYDVIIRNVKVNSKIKDIAIQYEEVLSNQSINFVPKINEIKDLSSFFAHRTIDAENNFLQIIEGDSLNVNKKLSKFNISDNVFVV